MNYIQTLKSPRRRLTIVAFVIVLHIFMIYGWFNLKLYGADNHQPFLVHVDIVKDVPAPQHTTSASPRSPRR
jgi:hypothetical protein